MRAARPRKTTMRIDPDSIRAKLNQSSLGHTIFYSEETGSTNADAKALALRGAPGGAVAITGRQTAGRGRRGRGWEADFDGSVCMSIIFFPNFDISLAPRLSTAAALGVCRAVRSFGVDARIKWPNDILSRGKKLVGILAELGTSERGAYIVTGIGVNVNQAAFGGEIADTATSMKILTGEEQNRNAVIADILNECAPLFGLCGSDEGFAALLRDYRALSDTLGRPVRGISIGEEFSGTAESLDSLGRLNVRRENGALSRVDAGDVSIRPV